MVDLKMGQWTAVIFAIVYMLSTAYSNDVICSDALIDEKKVTCAHFTGFDEKHCENLDCYLVCVESLMVECQQMTQFFYHDPVVFRVKQRAMCHHKEDHTHALDACQQPKFTCNPEISSDYRKRSDMLYQQSVLYKQSGDFEAFKNITCILSTHLKRCLRVNVTDYCTETMAEYMSEFMHLSISLSECQDPQDTPLFIQFGGEVNCTVHVSDQFESNGTARSLQDSNEHATTNHLVQLTSTSPKNVQPIPSRCTPQSIEHRASVSGCTLSYTFDNIKETRELCKDMDCKLKCYDEVIQDCDEYNPFLSKLRNRLFFRFICNETWDGRLAEARKTIVSCYRTRCFQNYQTLMVNEKDFDKYCRYLDKLRRCQLYFVTDYCPQHIVEFFKAEFVVSMDICDPEESPYFDEFNHTDYQCISPIISPFFRALGTRCSTPFYIVIVLSYISAVISIV